MLVILQAPDAWGRPTGLSGCPRTDGNAPTGVRAPVLGFWPLRVSTHGRQRPLGVRAPVLGRSHREENDDEREGEEGDVVDKPGEPTRALPNQLERVWAR